MDPQTDHWERPRKGKRGWVLLLVSLLVVVGGGAGLYVIRNRGHWKLSMALAGIRARGIPTNPEQFYRKAGPANEAAGNALDQAMKLGASVEDRFSASLPLVDMAELPPLGSPLPPAMRRDLQTFVHAEQPCYQKLREADQPSARFAFGRTQALGVPRWAARVWLLRALLEQAENRLPDAIQDWLRALRVQRVLDGQPFAVDASQVRGIIDVEACDAK